MSDQEWSIVRDDLVPNSVNVYPSNGPGTYVYATMMRRIVEQKRDGEQIMVRERFVRTEPLYLKDRPDMALAFSVAISALREIESAIRAKEKHSRGGR